jgi:hypothetical protein
LFIRAAIASLENLRKIYVGCGDDPSFSIKMKIRGSHNSKDIASLGKGAANWSTCTAMCAFCPMKRQGQQPVDFGMMCADARFHRLVSQNKHELLWQLCQACRLRLHLGV